MRRVAWFLLLGGCSSLFGQRLIETVAGGAIQDGLPASSVGLNGLGGITGDTAGNLYFSEPGAHLLRRISPDGIIETIAGTGILGSLGAGGPAVSAQLLYVADMAAGRDGTVYFSQPDLGQIWGITPDGRAALVAGSIVTLYGTGEGLTTPALPDGALVLSTPYSLRRPVWSP